MFKMRSITIPEYIKKIVYFNGYPDSARIVFIHQNYAFKKSHDPQVSIAIPAHNEEANILKTLHSLCINETKRPIEIIVVNNNSTDKTEALIKACGVRCVNESVQGITAARNAGLGAAKGKYVLSADADVIYPKDWIEEMIAPLERGNTFCVTYSRFSFLPSQGTPRWVYFFYEYFADIAKAYNRYFKDEAVNVYGFNMGFRRLQAINVDWFNHPRDSNEDGWLALKLRDRGFGELFYVKSPKALVWTTDRRIKSDGGLIKGIIKRIKRTFFNIYEPHPGIKNKG